MLRAQLDTHVWDIACRYYTPHLRGKSLTKKIHGEVQAAFVDRFGSHAGWAHNTLFISELASTRERVPALAAAGRGGKGKRKAGGGDAGAAGKAEESDSEGNEGSSSGSKASAGGSGGSSFSQELQRAGAVPVTPPEAGEVAAGPTRAYHAG
ncbi:N-glycosylase DNA lyase OGG1 [Micractinium conductrix]|uniref:N-glycosylase DNA lyase OGG1 n=1 Tax=Micractinium conductrix TaxID=554055 RepID=A0A2P6VB13_9CHLO|nr:N-glycosylase DNA lyase OGG1 [Micractinium conductrix]|eukprot:PSC71280.1 N-glycosylase DNA lyase OGG1 [Micractinium conductrix]